MFFPNSIRAKNGEIDNAYNKFPTSHRNVAEIAWFIQFYMIHEDVTKISTSIEKV